MNYPDKSRITHFMQLAAPIIAAQLTVSISNLVDAAMVASLNNPEALAAVGISNQINMLLIALLVGFSVGVQTLVARRIGEKNIYNLIASVNAGIIVTFFLGLVLMLTLLLWPQYWFGLFNDNTELLPTGSKFLQYRAPALIFIGMNFCFRGYWNGVGKSAVYLLILLTIQISSVAFNYGFIFGELGLPEFGAAGAGLGGTCGTLVGTSLYIFSYLYRNPEALKIFPDRETLLKVINLGLPNSVQQMLLPLATTLFYVILGHVGINELAVGHVLLTLNLVIALPAGACGIAATTLVSQAMGRGEMDDAHRWAWDAVKLALPFLGIIALPLLLAPEWIFSLFMPEHTELGQLANWPMRIVGLSVISIVLAQIFSQALLGTGDNTRVMLYSAGLQWLLMLPLSWLIASQQGSLTTIWLIGFIERSIAAALFIRRWQQRQWQHRRL